MMKKIARVLLLAGLVLVYIGCGGGSSGGAGGSAGGGGEYKDTITWGQGADVTSFDPHVGRQTPAVQVTNHIFDTLVQFDGTSSEVIPQIAESWEQLSPTSYRFHIRQGVKFHDGTELTAEDVKYSLDRAVASSMISYLMDFISETIIEGPYTVVVNTHFPYAPTLRNLSVPFAAILPKAYTETDPDIQAKKPVGSGPYQFVSWTQSDSAVLEAFADYYAGPPKTKNLVMKVIPEASQRTIALETGEIDLAYDLPSNDHKLITGNEKLSLFLAPPLSLFYLSMHMGKTPFENKLVRQAISHAIDRQLIIDTVVSGAAQAADAIIAPGVYGYYSAGVDQYDPERSKQLLAQAGYPNGFTTSLWVNNNQERVEVSTAIVDMLREVGITARLEVMEAGAFWDKTDNGEHEMAFFGWITSTKDADYTYYSLGHSSKFGPGGNTSYISDPQVDALIEKGRNSTEPATREQAYKDLAILLADLTPYISIMYSPISAGGNKLVEHFEPDPIGYHRLENVQVRK
ncbi:MAG: ABC transporter substrate-binding protein [Spirochaetaceae bacterium]|jgi:peptide/nickel transport system substrate-binding protein|nr:ABC transporter substrate-binding protein [Spirochaetaceae bacterium]